MDDSDNDRRPRAEVIASASIAHGSVQPIPVVKARILTGPMICSRCLRARSSILLPPGASRQLARHLPARQLSSLHASQEPQRVLRLIGDWPSIPAASISQRAYAIPARRRPYSTTTTSEANSSSPPSKPASTALQKPDDLDAAESQIWDRLASEFAPAALEVRDVSGGCGSMYAIQVVSERFSGKSMLQQQRMVNGVLGDLMKGWHGVQLRTRAP